VPFKYQPALTAVLLGLLLVVVVAFAIRARTEEGPTRTSAPTQPRFEAERITIREWGCEPKQITRPVGPFMLIIQNQSGFPEIDLSLVDESGRPRHRLPDTRNELTWKQRLELPPGTLF
jgi:hypothetical protein